MVTPQFVTASNPFGSERLIEMANINTAADPVKALPSVGSFADRAKLFHVNPVEIKRMPNGIFGAKLVEVSGQKFIKKQYYNVQSAVHEVLAYEVCAALGYSFVPQTFLCRDDEWAIFSLQRFAEGYRDCPDSFSFNRIERRMMVDVYCFDWLIQMRDRHNGNVLYRSWGDDCESLKDLLLIDHGISFDDSEGEIGVCYRHAIDERASLNSFASRLANADLSFVYGSLETACRESFEKRIKMLVKDAFTPFGEWIMTLW